MEDIALPIQSPGSFTSLIAVGLTVYFLALIAAGLRVYTRLKIIRAWKWDDTTMAIAFATFTAQTFCALAYALKVQNKTILIGKTLYDIAALLTAAECFYTITMMVLKLSLALFFLGIFVDSKHRFALFVTMTISTLLGTIFFFFNAFQCGYAPTGKIFIEKTIAGTCVSHHAVLGMNWTHNVMSAITDLALVAIPLSAVWSLQLAQREKITVTILFCLGSSSVIASLIRLAFVDGLNPRNSLFFRYSKKYLFCCSLESGIGVLAGCLMSLKKLLDMFLKPTSPTSSSARSGAPTEMSSIKPRYQTKGEKRHSLLQSAETVGITDISEPTSWLEVTQSNGEELDETESGVEMKKDMHVQIPGESGNFSWIHLDP